MDATSISVELLDRLCRVTAQHPVVLGCARRNRLEVNSMWRNTRGDALLSSVGVRFPVITPVQVADAFLFQLSDGTGVLLQFRGGRRMPWWEEDARDLAALVLTFTGLRPAGVSTISELDGKLSTFYTPSPLPEWAATRAGQLVAGWQAWGRIRKDSVRGVAVCHRCPVKQQCDAMDMEKGETGDWPRGNPASAHD